MQSLCFDLLRLCLALERGLGERESARMAPRLLRAAADFRPLEPSVTNGTLTVADVLAAPGPDEHARAVEAWARDVWQPWSPHHDAVHAWLDRDLRRTVP